MPLNTNGIETTTQVSTTDHALAMSDSGTNGIVSWVTKQRASVTPKSSEWRQRLSFTFRKRCGWKWTISAPAVIPNSATEIATNAKWYHMVTLKIRVRAISYISVESVIVKRPA
jgi:hypothetical protein